MSNMKTKLAIMGVIAPQQPLNGHQNVELVVSYDIDKSEPLNQFRKASKEYFDTTDRYIYNQAVAESRKGSKVPAKGTGAPASTGTVETKEENQNKEVRVYKT
jgi:hypothetical protein